MTAESFGWCNNSTEWNWGYCSSIFQYTTMDTNKLTIKILFLVFVLFVCKVLSSRNEEDWQFVGRARPDVSKFFYVALKQHSVDILEVNIIGTQCNKYF